MKKKYVAIVLALLCKCSIWAQDIKVKSFVLDPTDLTAQHENIKDANGDMCALIKVQILAETVKFEGDIIGQPKHKLNEYYVNVIDGTQRLMISAENTMPTEIEFSQFNIDEVKGGNTYVMKIQMPEKAPGATFELGMPNVPIIVDGKSYKTDDTGGLDLPLNKGKHTFCVSMQGYNSYEGTFEIDQLPVIKHIVMQRDYNLKNNGLLTITYPLNAEFLITPVNGAAKPKKQKIKTGEQIALNGEYQVSFVKKKYKPQTMTVSVDVGKEMKKGFTGVSLDADDRLASNDFSKTICDSEYELIVLPCGDNLKAEDLKLFQEKRNESAIVSANEYNDDLISSILEDSSTFTSLDFIFARKERTKPDDTYLIEISNITRSTLNRVNSRNENIAHQVYAERNKEIKIDKPQKNKEKKENYFISICNSFRNLLGDVQMDNTTGKVKIAASKKYKSHILKVLPLIYKENYYNDPYLLHSFINNVESATRIGDGSFWCKILKYDLMFILSIQNNKQNKYMEITNSASFKLGIKIGKMAKPLKKAIGSFEKNYVGLLSRRVSTKDDCIGFVTDISQKLVMHNGMWATMCAEVCDDLANISESEYDKDELSFGFLDGYFKYEPTDKKKDFQKRLEKILADYSDNEDLKDEVSKLNLIVDDINHKN